MGNSIKYEILKEPNYNDIAKCIGASPRQKRWKRHPDWGIKLLKFHATDTRLYIGAFENDKLVGCMIAHADRLIIKGEILNCAIIAITEVIPTHEKKGIASKMLDKMLSQIQLLDFDMALAFQSSGRGGRNILKRAGFKKIHKYSHAAKVLDKDTMRNLLDINPILKNLAMKIADSKIGQTNPLRGSIREARNEDLENIIDLLNNRSKKIDITNFWTKENLKKKKDWRYKVFIFEDKGEILASVIRYEEISYLGENEFLCGFLKELAFREGIEEIEKEIFIYNVLKTFKVDNIPNVSYPTSKPWVKILKKTGFRVLPGERTVFIKPLSDIAKQTVDKIDRFRSVNAFLIC
ncbi:MAG: GNAT family N-acetyltransferase [Candidatus Hodarchaeota archaeon]